MLPFLLALGACAQHDPNAVPDFVDDCGEDLNEVVEGAAGLLSTDQQTYDAVLCRDEVDYYQIAIPPGRWVSVEMVIEGDFAGVGDLDLYETDAQGADVWYSASDQDYERLAWYNPGSEPTLRYLRVEGYNGASALYKLVVRATPFHEGLDCDAFYPDGGNTGPCNEILQFPQAQDAVAEAFWVAHDAHYSNLRRELVYLVRYAAAETAAAFPDTNPLALMDMSERDGGTPGAMVGRLRHPEGTHVGGNDIDIAYYQTGPDNAGRPVCTQNDGYFCTGPTNLLDARRTAFFLAKLMDSPNVRVIGVDPKIAEKVKPAAWDLVDEGILDTAGAQKVNGNKLAYGDGWPFHHHHLHFSWRWEEGLPMRQQPAEGCVLSPEADPYAALAE